MTTKTRTLVALATLSLATAAYAINAEGNGSADAAATGLLAGGSRVEDGIRTTVLEFRTTGSARHEAEHLLVKAHQAPRGAISCDLHKESLSVAGVPDAQGVVVDNRTGHGSTKIATIAFSKGQFTFQLSAEAKPGSLPLRQLKREARRAYRSLAP